MANNHGGPRTPSNPSPVSGPGQLSRRTDGGPSQTTQPMTGLGYGENADYNDIQSSAPLAATPSVSNTRARKTSSPTGSSVVATPLFSPTQRPDEPITAGADVGPGPGADQSMRPTYTLAETLEKLLPYDDSGDIAAFYDIAVSRGW